MSHVICALDPGVTTGVCTGYYTEVGGSNQLLMMLDEFRWTPYQFYEEFEHWLDREHDKQIHVIYEDFAYRNVARTGLDLTPVKLIGVIEVFEGSLDRPHNITFTKQQPATGKSYYTDDALKRMGVYVRGKHHARDAQRHLLHWLTFGAGSQFFDIDKTELLV